MIKYLIATLGLLLILAMWRIDNVTASRDAARDAVTVSDAKVSSLRVTLRLSRELMSEQAAIETNYLAEVRSAEEEAEYWRGCSADGTCGLRVAATCPGVRVDGAGAAAGEPDAGAPKLTAAAERAYPALVAGIKTQRAQLIGLQAELIALHSKCKIGVTP